MKTTRSSLARRIAAAGALLACGMAHGPAPQGHAGPAPQGDAAPRPAADPLAVEVPAFSNSSCPVMGKPISSRLFTDTEFGRIWICCKGCDKRIAKDPAAALKAAYPKVTALENRHCPVTGDAIGDEPVVVRLQGYELRVHSAACAQRARADSQAVLAKALRPELAEVGNVKCPVSGDPVADNAFCVVGTSIVRLHSAACVDEVRKEPARVLEAARADARAAKQR